MTGVGVQHRFTVRCEKASGSVKRWSRYAETKKRERFVNNGTVRVGVAPATLNVTRAPRDVNTQRPSVLGRGLGPIQVYFDLPETAGLSRFSSRRWMVFILPVTRRRAAAQTKGVRVMGAGGRDPSPPSTQCWLAIFMQLDTAPLRRGRRQH